MQEWCTEPRTLIWPSITKSDGTDEFVMTGLVDGCSVLQETQFVGTCLFVDTTRDLYARSSFPLITAARERPEFDVKPPLGALLQMFFRLFPDIVSTRGCFRKSAGCSNQSFIFLLAKGHRALPASHTAGKSVQVSGLCIRQCH